VAPALPSLTVCIPTHEGRGATIGDALASVAGQLRPEDAGRLTVAVSDNGSRDGAEAVVAAAARAGLPVRYHRSERDLGFARNLDRVVEMAEGDWCWLLSSDDALMPGAIGRVLELLAAYPDVEGLTVNQLVLDRVLREPPAEQPTPILPPLHDVTLLLDLDDVVARLGIIMSGVSSQIVRRDRWIAAGAGLRSRAGHAGMWFAHLAIPLRMVATGGGWLWCPEKLVAVRSGNVDPILRGRPRLQGELLAHLDGEWREAVGARGRGRREILARYRRGLEALGTFDQIRRDVERGPRDSAWLLWTFARAFWRSPGFWLRDAPRLTRSPRRARPPRPPSGRALGALASGAGRVEVSAALAPPVRRADMLELRCRVRNRGGVALASVGLHPVHLAARWTSPRGDVVEGGRIAFARPLRAGGRRTLRCPLNAPLATGDWELRVTLVQDGVGWLDGDGDAVAPVTVLP